MSGSHAPTDPKPVEAVLASLLDLALSRPSECREQASQLLRKWHRSEVPSALWQALGIAERQSGDVALALRYLRRAVRVADRHEGLERRADAKASLAATLAFAGRSEEALAIFDEVTRLAGGLTAARSETRRAIILWMLGRFDDALGAFRRCLPVLRQHHDVVWEARALVSRGALHAERGAAAQADADLARAAELLSGAGQDVGSARAWQNRGWLRYRMGDLPAALELLATSNRMFVDAFINEPSVEVDLCTALLAAGLAIDALQHARRALELAQARSISGIYRAETELTVANAAFIAGDVAMAVRHAAAARRAYRKQQHDRGERLAALAEVRARFAMGQGDGRLLRQVLQVTDDLAMLHAYEAAEAQFLAGRVALAAGRRDVADERLSRAAAYRHRGSALMRTTGWLAQALRADAAGSSAGVFRAARSGLRLLDEHRLSLGATELRAAATSHGAELASLAVRHAHQHGSARDLLLWSERWRATTLALSPVRPPKGKALTADLAKLREVTHKVSEARAAGAPTEPIERERRRLEEAIRSRTLTIRGDPTQRIDRFDVAELLAALDGRRLASIVDVDGDLCVLVAGDGRVRRFGAGRTNDAAREVDFARFSMRTAAGAGETRARTALQRLDATAARLQAILLGDAVRALGDKPIVLVPPARLHATPWAVLPALRDRAITVAPSAATWLRARRRRPPRRRDIVLVAGPDLGSRGAEIDELRDTHPQAQVFTDDAATCEAVLKSLDGAWLAHVAAHGTLRADNPLFSALTLHDGPLTVYDLERLRRAPYRLILSACESGIGTTAGADEVLGLASAVISLGTAGLMGSTVIVDDLAAVRVSLIVHRHLRDGADLAHALLAARRETADDPVGHVAALAFLALGSA